jgi:hypothetical protein
MYGYEVFRAEGDGDWHHLSSVRAVSRRFEDAQVVAGTAYRYRLRPYDTAGNRGPESEVVRVEVGGEEAPRRRVPIARDEVGCVGNRR